MRLKKLTGALSLLTISGLAGLCIGGCAEDRTTLFIHHVYAFDGEDCEVNATSDTFLSSGTWDSSVGAPYVAWLVIANGLQPLGDNDTLRAETSRIQVEGAEVALSSASGATALPAFTVPLSGTIDPDASEDPGFAVISVPLIPGDANLDNGQYVVGITVFGTTLGGKSVESPEFSFPVTVSRGWATFCGSEDSDDFRRHPCGTLAQDGFYLGVCDRSVDPNCCTGTDTCSCP